MSEFDALMKQKAVALKYDPEKKRGSCNRSVRNGVYGGENYGNSHGSRGSCL